MKAEGSGGDVLVSPRRKWVGLLLLSAGFTAGGVSIITTGDDARGWLVAVFFGLCSIVGLALAVRPYRLEIDERGMTSHRLWIRDRYEFDECGSFSTWRNPAARSQRLVVFDCTGPGRRSLRNLNRRLTGRTTALPDTYGLDAAELAHLLNERRDARLSTNPPSAEP